MSLLALCRTLTLTSLFLAGLLAPAVAQTAQSRKPAPLPSAKGTAPLYRSWHDYWKAIYGHSKDEIPDPAAVIRRSSVARPRSGNLGTETSMPFFSGTDTSYGFANSYDQFAVLQRQTNCSLTEFVLDLDYQSDLGPASKVQSITNFDQYLHKTAGMTTTGGTYANGCADPAITGVLLPGVYLGTTSSGNLIGAASVYSDPAGLHIMVGNASTFTLTSNQVTELGGDIFGMLAADFNGDGKMDLAVITNTESSPSVGQINILLGNGDGTFQAPTALVADTNVYGLVAGNFGKGHIDLVATAQKSSGDWELLYYTGNGKGGFSSPVSTDTGSTEILVDLPVDINKDGAVDIVGWEIFSTSYPNYDEVTSLINNGSAAFTPTISPTHFSSIGELAVGDLNNDGKLDLVAASNLNELYVMKGSGAGAFTLQNTYSSIYRPTPVRLTDVDGDGNLDIILAAGEVGYYGPTPGPEGATFGQVLLGNGDFTFSMPPALFPFTSGVTLEGTAGSIAVAKLNADAYPDIAAYGHSSTVSVVSTYLGTATSAFTTGTTTTFNIGPAAYDNLLLTSDLNGDGHPDLLITGVNTSDGSAAIQAALNNGSGAFTVNSTILTLPAQVVSMVTADFASTGKQDLAYLLNDGNSGPSNGLYVALGNGNGTFGTPILIDSTVSAGVYLQTADINGDGKPDLIVLQNSNFDVPAVVSIYLNQGASFAAAKTFQVPAGDSIGSFVVADFNGDGAPDLALIGIDNLYTYLGNKTGAFTYKSTLSLQDEGAQNGVALDFNKDGKIDILTDGCCGLAAPQLLLGNGDGTFNSGLVFAVPVSASGVAAITINGSAYPSAVFPIDLYNNAYLQLAVNQYANAPSLTKAATQITGLSTVEVVQGQQAYISFNVVETSGGGQPTGTVTLTSGSTVLDSQFIASGSGYLLYNVPTSTAAGLYTYTVNYLGDDFNLPTSATVTIQVYNATQIDFTPENPIAAGSTATLKATVTRVYSSGTPSGKVSFYGDSGNELLGSASLVNGVATFTAPTTGIPPGTYILQAAYFSGTDTADEDAVSALIPVTVYPAGLDGTRTSLLLSPDPITLGQTGTLEATVTNAVTSATPTGTVNFYAEYDGTKLLLGSVGLNAQGKAIVTANTSGLYNTDYTLSAVYNGNKTFYTSTSPDLDIFLRYVSNVSVTANPASVTPGQTVTLTALVGSDDYAAPTGTVKFYADGVLIGSAALSSAGVATFSAPTTGIGAGTYNVTAVYEGDEFNGVATSSPVTLTVQ